MPNTLRIERLEKHYGEVRVLNDVSFEVESGEFLSLLGPSGCGKTTTLRCIAGFERPDSGRILFADKPITDIENGIFVPPNKRGFGMVFQSYAVWPHMTVAENVGYPLSVQGGVVKSEIARRVKETLDLVGMGGFGDRYPTQLSGGQQQRVALARALVMDPGVLLFDEPLSNLDAKLRERMRFELIELQKKIGIPAVFVTHDQAEAMVISRRILVMEGGRIAQVGRPEEIYHRPRTRFVADFVGLTNFISVRVLEKDGAGSCVVDGALGRIQVRSDVDVSVGDQMLLTIRPERMQLAATSEREVNSFEARLKSSFFVGPYSEYFLEVGGFSLRAQRSLNLSVGEGETVYVHVDPEHCLLLQPEKAVETKEQVVPAE